MIRIDTGHSYSVLDIAVSDDGADISYVGGETWAQGIAGTIDPLSLSHERYDSVLNGVVLDQYRFQDQIIYSGLDGFIHCDSGDCQVRRTNNFDLLRAAAITSDGYMVAGGAGFAIGYLYRYSQSNTLDSIYDFPFVIEDILVAEQSIFIFGFGACMRSQDGGVHWEFTDLEGGHFIKAIYIDEHIYAISSDGEIYFNNNLGREWELLTKVNIDKVQDFSVSESGASIVVGLDQEIAYTSSIMSIEDWIYYTIDAPSLRSTLILDSEDVLIGGDNGFIAKLNL